MGVRVDWTASNGVIPGWVSRWRWSISSLMIRVATWPLVITYYGFRSLFPLLLVLVSALGYTLDSDPALQHALVGSALQQFPIIDPELQQNVSSIHGSRLGVILGILGAVYGGLGVTLAIQNAFDRVWAVTRYARPNLVVSRLRDLVLFVLFGAVIVVTTALSVVVRWPMVLATVWASGRVSPRLPSRWPSTWRCSSSGFGC